MNVLREKLFINEDPNSVPPSIESAGEVTIETELGSIGLNISPPLWHQIDKLS
jgi:hypothetical protein